MTNTINKNAFGFIAKIGKVEEIILCRFGFIKSIALSTREKVLKTEKVKKAEELVALRKAVEEAMEDRAAALELIDGFQSSSIPPVKPRKKTKHHTGSWDKSEKHQETTVIPATYRHCKSGKVVPVKSHTKRVWHNNVA